MRIKQSLCFPLFRPEGMSLNDFFRKVAETGFTAIEFWQRPEDFQEIVAIAKGHGLAIAHTGGHRWLHDGLNKRSNHDRIEGELIESIDIAARHGVAGVTCLSGNRQPYQSDLDAIEACAEILRRVAPHAEKKGVNLDLELLNSKVDHPGYQCDHTAWGVAVCERVNSPRVKLLYDIYHMQIMEGDIIRTIRENIRWIGHFHTAGNPGRKDMDDTQELNYRGICRAIAEAGYDRYLGHEYSPKGDRLESLKRIFKMCDQGQEQ